LARIYLHEQNDVSVLRLAGAHVGLLDPGTMVNQRLTDEEDLLLLDALTEVASKLHRLQSDECIDTHEVKHLYFC